MAFKSPNRKYRDKRLQISLNSALWLTVSDVKIMSSNLDMSITNLARTCMVWIVDPNLPHSYPWELLCISKAAANGSVLCMRIV